MLALLGLSNATATSQENVNVIAQDKSRKAT